MSSGGRHRGGRAGARGAAAAAARRGPAGLHRRPGGLRQDHPRRRGRRGDRLPGCCTWTTTTRAGGGLGRRRRPGSATRSWHRSPAGVPGSTGASTGSGTSSPSCTRSSRRTLLVLEGVGSGSLELADVPRHPGLGDRRADLRLARGLERDGEAARDGLAAVDGRRAGALHRPRHRGGRRPARGRVRATAALAPARRRSVRRAAPGPAGPPAWPGRRRSPGCPSPGRCCRRRGRGSPTARRAAGDRDHLGPLEVAPLVAVDHDQSLLASATTRERTSANQRREGHQAEPDRVPRWKSVNVSWISGVKATQAPTHTISRPPPRAAPARRTPSGRQVCGRDTRVARVRVGRHGCR